MGEYGNYGFNHFNDNKKFINNTKYKSQYKKTSKISSFFSNLLVIIIALSIFCGTFGFIIFTDNKLGNEIREKYDINFQIGEKEKKDENTSNYQIVLENEEKKYNEQNINDEYYSDNSLMEQQQEIIDSGIIPTKTPTEITNEMTIVTVDGAGNIIQETVQGDRNPTPTQKPTPIVSTNPTTILTQTPIPTQTPNPTPIITPKPAVVTPIIVQPTTIPTQIITPIPEMVTPIIIQPTTTPIPTQVTTPIPTIVEQETYNINQDAYNNAENIANNYNDVTNALLIEINNVRNNNGLTPLTIDTTLNKMAGYRAYDMGENAYFSHSYNGVSQLRVVMYAYNRLTVRHYENLGKASLVEQNELATKIVKGWCDSPSHYGVLTNGNLSIIGIAIHKDTSGTWYIATIYS